MENVWKQLICQTCGSNAVEIVDGLLCCKVCKSKHTLQEKISEEEVISLNVAATDRNAYKFEDALERYELLLQKHPDNEAANWGALLADYGIAYVKDYDGKLIPTCHRLNERPIDVCSYYYKLNDGHKAQAQEIEKLRLAIMSKANKIQPYDVFICYKATEEVYGRSIPTQEASWGKEIYTMLKHKLNLRVFFSEESLPKENVEWEPHIYKALNTAKLMFVLTTGKENVNAVWVKNEWKRYSRYIKEGQDKTIRVVYDIMNAYDLPKELQDTQAIPHNSMSWGEAVRKAAESIFAAKKEKPEWQKAIEEMQAKMNASAENGKTVIADKYCVNCGAGGEKNIKYCPDCGGGVFAPEFKQYCLECGAEASLLKKFCSVCGKSLFVYTKEEYQKEVERRERALGFDIENGVFEKYSGTAKEVVIPKRVTSIGEEAFSGCNNLTSIIIPDSVTNIAKDAFKNCRNLTSVKITDIKAWLAIEFGNVAANPLYYAEELYLNNELITELIVPNGVTNISERACYCFKGLTSITIPNSVTDIGEYAFSNCKKLTSIKVDRNNKNYQDIDGNLYSKDGKILIQYAIGKNTTLFKIPNSVTSIGKRVFYGCSSLTSITIPDSVTSIGKFAFYCCKTLTSITIPDGIKSIGDFAFAGCSSLTSITIPNSVTSIGNSAFYNCSSLQYNIKDNGKYLGPPNNPYLYLAKTVSTDITNFTIDKNCKTIDSSAFYNCSSLTSVEIPDSVESIDRSAFLNCSSLTSITVRKSNKNYKDVDGNLYSKDGTVLIKYIAGKTAKSFTIPDSVTSIGEEAFYDCDSLTSITIPDSVTSIGDRAFSSCNSLRSITIPDSVTSIGDYTFKNCNSLTSITIPESVTSIGDYAFQFCNSLTSIVIPDSVTSIGEWAFDECNSLTSVVIGNSVTSIAWRAFGYCDSLTSIKFTGTKEQWNKISKDSAWKNGVPATEVVCTDGTVAL